MACVREEVGYWGGEGEQESVSVRGSPRSVLRGRRPGRQMVVMGSSRCQERSGRTPQTRTALGVCGRCLHQCRPQKWGPHPHSICSPTTRSRPQIPKRQRRHVRQRESSYLRGALEGHQIAEMKTRGMFQIFSTYFTQSPLSLSSLPAPNAVSSMTNRDCCKPQRAHREWPSERLVCLSDSVLCTFAACQSVLY